MGCRCWCWLPDGGYEKVLSNLSEVKARGGKVIAITTEGGGAIHSLADHVVEVPAAHPLLRRF